MAIRKATVMGVVVVLALVGVVVSVLGLSVVSRTIPTGGTIMAIGLGAYSDSGCCLRAKW
jgi:hypothetical protein